LPQPDEAGDTTIHRLFQQPGQLFFQGGRNPASDAILDPAFGFDQRTGA